MNTIDKLHNCDHEWKYMKTVPFIQGFLQRARHCEKCNVVEYGFGLTEEEIMNNFLKTKENK